MKNFQDYKPAKYSTSSYELIEEGIYKTQDPYLFNRPDCYVTSLSFEHEPDMFGEEDGSPLFISQTPLEDILDMFTVYITDFYEDLNEKSNLTCYQEFGSPNIEDIKKLRKIIGKRVYAKSNETEDSYDIVIE